jgi:hypothetical protein
VDTVGYLGPDENVAGLLDLWAVDSLVGHKVPPFALASICLIRKLPCLFSPEIVYDLTEGEVRGLVAESDETAAERARYIEKLADLKAGLLDLKRLDSRRSNTMAQNSELSEEETLDED